jgi:hypothetical protein
MMDRAADAPARFSPVKQIVIAISRNTTGSPNSSRNLRQGDYRANQKTQQNTPNLRANRCVGFSRNVLSETFFEILTKPYKL